jgi:hypothetical protein
MKKQYLFGLWGGLFTLCAALGFISNPGKALQILMTLLSVAFFVPGGLLLWLSAKSGDRDIALLIRNLSAASLILTAILIIFNFFSALGSALLGNILHSILIVVSSPMVCSGYWALSLFLWACLMISAINILKAKKNP